MVAPRDILALANEIRRRFQPEKLVLFGSYARGTPTEDSDVDLLVLMPHRGPSYRAASHIRLAVNVNFPMDIIVRSPTEMRRRLELKDRFLMDILEQGLVLHDANDSRVGEQGRRRLRRRLHSAPLAKAQSL